MVGDEQVVLRVAVKIAHHKIARMDDLGRTADDGGAGIDELIGPLVLEDRNIQGRWIRRPVERHDGNVVTTVAVIIESDLVREMQGRIIPDVG